MGTALFTRIKKWLIRILMLLALFILLLTAFLWTESGSRFLIEKIAAHYDIELQEVRGNLIQGFDIGHLSYTAAQEKVQPRVEETKLQKISASQLSFRWQPMGLFYSAIKLQSLSAQDLSIEWTTPKNKKKDQVWPSFAQVFLIELNQLQVNKIHLIQNQQEWLLNNVKGSLSLGAFNLQLNPLEVEFESNKITTQGKIATHFPYAFNLEGAYALKHKETEKNLLQTNYKAKGDFTEFKLQSNADLTPSSAQNKNASPENAIDLVADIKTGIEQKENKLVSLLQKIDKKGKAAPAPKNIQCDLSIHLKIKDSHQFLPSESIPAIQDLDLTTHLNLKINQPLAELNELQLHSNDTKASFSLLGHSMQLNIASSLPIRWNKEGILFLPWSIESASLIDLQAEPDNKQKSAFNNKVNAQGTAEIKLQLPIHSAEFSVIAADTELSLSAPKISLKPYTKAVTGQLASEFKLSAHYSPAQGLMGEISNLNLKGELLNQPLEASGGFGWKNSEINQANLTAKLGLSELQLNGNLDKHQLDWRIRVPNLKDLPLGADNNSQGEINSFGSLKGDINKPQVEMSLSAKNISWQRNAAESLELQVKSSSANDQQMNLQAKAVNIQGELIDSVDIKATGKVDQQSISFSIKNNRKDAALKGEIKGQVESGWQKIQNKKDAPSEWRAQWKSFAIQLENLPAWQLISAQPMKANRNGGQISDLCVGIQQTENEFDAPLVPEVQNFSVISSKNSAAAKIQSSASSIHSNNRTTVCVNAQINLAAKINQNIWDAHLDLVGLPAHYFNLWTKTESHLLGAIDGQMDAWQKVKSPVAAKASLKSRGLAFAYQFQDERAEIYKVDDANLTADFFNQQWNAQVQFDLGAYGYLNAKGAYHLATHKIQTKLDAQLNSLAPLESLVPFLNNVQGKAFADISVTGTPESPKITGNFSVQEGTATIPTLGLSLTNIQVRANSFADDNIHLDARITSGDGTLVVNGSLENFGKDNWRWDSNVFGANIRVIENPLLSATLNPNLRVQASPELISLTGSTEIPWARATMKSLPASATRLSKDVVLVTSGGAQAEQKIAQIKKSQNLGAKLQNQSSVFDIPLYTNMLVYFGDDVRFKGFGLDSQLLGKVNLLKEKNRQMFTTGFVGVGKGNYKAYGQELKIERGRLIFQGPYDNPGLDIRALRELENVSAGLEIGGTLQHPKSTVFSVPASTPSEAMALLVTGKPLAQSSQADAYALLGAISNLGMDDGDSMSTDIAHRFSLDELGIKADKGLEQSSLWVGKYITPKLFVRYVVGLFDQAFSVGMRYQLNEKFRLEAESGKTQSIDIIYKIER